MNDGSLSASDIALLNNDGGIGGFNGLIWLFALIALCSGGGFGGFGFGNNAAAALGLDNMATEASMQRGFDNQNSMANQREILAAVNNGTNQMIQTVNGTYHDTLNALSDKYSELQRDIAAVQVSQQQAIANENECCCNTKMLIAETGAGVNANIAQNRYEAAMNTASINANTTAQVQKVLDSLAQNKIDALQAQVNQLQLQNATAGVLKFPNNWSYGAGPFPPIFGCACGNANV